MVKSILLLGASGTAGSEIRKSLLKNTDYQLKLFSRHANKLTIDSARERTFAADVHDRNALNKAMNESDIVISALSAENSDLELSRMAQEMITSMKLNHINRLIFMVAMGIYNEIPAEIDGKDNVKNNPNQIHNLKAAQIIESSNLNYTLLRPGMLIDGPNTAKISQKGEPVSGFQTSLSSLADVTYKLVTNKIAGSNESLGINL